MPTSKQPYQFQGFAKPAYTQIPDEFFDELAPHLSEAELRVLLYVMRRTFGFKKDIDAISLRQMVEGIRRHDGEVLDQGTGMSRQGVTKGVRGLVEKGVLIAKRNFSQEKGDEPTTYELRFLAPPVVTTLRGGSPLGYQGGRNDVASQETVKQETVLLEGHPVPNPLSNPEGNPSNNRLSTRTKEKNRREVDATSSAPVSRTSAGMQRLGDLLNTASPLGTTMNPNHPIPQGERLGGSEPNSHSPRDIRTQEPLRGAATAEVGNQSSDPATGVQIFTSERQDLPSTPAQAGERARTPKASRRGVPMSPERVAIASYISQFAEELGDQAKPNASISRALHIYEQSGITDLGHFTGLLLDARRRTQQSTEAISRRAQERGRKPSERLNKVPYFFATLEQLCGLRGAPEQHSAQAPLQTSLKSHSGSTGGPSHTSLLSSRYPEANKRIRESSPASDPPRTSLAGKYARYVRR